MNPRHLSRRVRLAAAPIAGLALLVAAASTAQAATSVGLGTADTFVVLAGEGVTNTGPTTLSGDLGTTPNPSVTGAASITFASGTNYADSGPTAQAKLDLGTAFDNAAGQGPTSPIAADLAGLTLVPGVYNSASSIGLDGALTLDGQNNPDAVWIFQAGSDLIVSSAAVVNLINSAQACHVFWQVGSSASLGTGASFVGTIMALTSITLDTGATVQGRVLARNGTVTLDTNTITRPVCAAPQVTAVPAGAVATGDGSTSQGITTGKYLLIGVLVVTAAGAIGAAAGLRRKQST
jgi:type VI secretion system secreted protein VgrG